MRGSQLTHSYKTTNACIAELYKAAKGVCDEPKNAAEELTQISALI